MHRLWKSQLGVKAGAASAQERKVSYLAEATKHASDQERNAAQAEREAVDLKKVEYMADFLGDEFAGFISGITAFGIFVELENGVEGLIRISQIHDDYYQYFEKEWKLVGQRTGRQFRLGDPLKVKLIKASPEERQLTFAIAGEDDNGNLTRPKGQRTFAAKKNAPKGKVAQSAAGKEPEKKETAAPKAKKGNGYFAKRKKR